MVGETSARVRARSRRRAQAPARPACRVMTALRLARTLVSFLSTTMAAALAFHQPRSWFAAARLPLARISLAAAFVPTFLATQKPFTWAIPSLPSLLELFPPWLLAVPKKKTSHSRKAMRSANKGLKDKQSTTAPTFYYKRRLTCFHARPCSLPGMRLSEAGAQSLSKML